MSMPLYDAATRAFNAAFRKQEAENGICCEPGDCFVAEEDREPATTVGLFDGIPSPVSPVETERQRDQRIADELRERNYTNACRATTQDEE